jgi:hypothetical protein
LLLRSARLVLANGYRELSADSDTHRIIAIVLAFVTFILLATFPGWHVETNREGSDVDVKPFPSRPVSQAALAFVFIASVFVLVSFLSFDAAAECLSF